MSVSFEYASATIDSFLSKMPEIINIPSSLTAFCKGVEIALSTSAMIFAMTISYFLSVLLMEPSHMA